MLLKLMQDIKPFDYIGVCMESNSKTFRKKLYSDYKSTRERIPSTLQEQIPIIIAASESCGVTVNKSAGFEGEFSV